MKFGRILLFLTVLAMLSFSVNASIVVPRVGEACDEYYKCGPCQVCDNGYCRLYTPQERLDMALGYLAIPEECCLIANNGGFISEALTAASVQTNHKVENCYGEVYAFRKGEVMDAYGHVGPTVYPLTTSETLVDPIDKCTIGNMNEYPPWTSSPQHNCGCYNLVPATQPNSLETHYTLIKMHGTQYIDGAQRDTCGPGEPDIWRTLTFNAMKDPAGKLKGTNSKKFQGSELEVLEPEFIDWTGSSEEYYPFVFTSNENWDVNVELYVPEGLQVVSDNPIYTLIAGESKIILFKVRELVEGAGEGTGAAVLIDAGHGGAKQRDVSVISSAAVKESKPTTAKMTVRPAGGDAQEAESQITNVEQGPVSSEFLLFAGVALVVIVAIALYMSLMKKK